MKDAQPHPSVLILLVLLVANAALRGKAVQRHRKEQGAGDNHDGVLETDWVLETVV